MEFEGEGIVKFTHKQTWGVSSSNDDQGPFAITIKEQKGRMKLKGDHIFATIGHSQLVQCVCVGERV